MREKTLLGKFYLYLYRYCVDCDMVWRRRVIRGRGVSGPLWRRSAAAGARGPGRGRDAAAAAAAGGRREGEYV